MTISCSTITAVQNKGEVADNNFGPNKLLQPPIKKFSPILSTETNNIKKLSAKEQECLQEINQNLAFFCMNHQKHKNFQDEKQCLSYTKKVLDRCEEKHKKTVSTSMVHCVKKQLNQ